MGIGVQLGQVDSGVFFASAAGNDQTYTHNYRDIQMYTRTNDSPFPSLFMQEFYAGPDNSNVSQASNDWTGTNVHRYVNPEYDALYDEARSTIDAERSVELFIQMNDIVVNDVVAISQVSRAAQKYAISNELVPDNVAASAWEPLYWNIANWTAIDQG